jgi:glycine/D-amino acid oxidase-like deaminating enzyme
MTQMENWKNISLWMDQLDEPLTPRSSLNKDISVDVAIMGAGYTGLWTAYYLKQQNPGLSIAIVEAQTAGFGASGRNGGWLIGELSGQDKLLKDSTEQQRTLGHHLIHGIPDEVARVLEKEGIECDYQKGGMLCVAARYPEQTESLRASYKSLEQLGYEAGDNQWLEGSDLTDKINIEEAKAAIFNPHCASIHPAKLVRGLARAVEGLGVKIYENTPALNWKKGSIKTPKAQIETQWVVPALEAYGATLKKSLYPLSKYHLPVQSLIIATEPLSEKIWLELGVKNGEVFSDYSRQVTYGIRTKDNRLVFGARGSYIFGGRLRHNFKLTDTELNLRKDIMIDLFPQLKHVKITHAWGGNLSMARKFHPHMVADQDNQFAMAGGYGGEGVGASNLAGRTLADLILNKETHLTSMPWVNKQGGIGTLKKWEVEPIPWLGYKTVIKSFDLEDKVLNDKTAPIWKRKLVIGFASLMEKFVE